MKCFVCGGEMKPYFVKKIGVKYLRDIDTFEYERCENCGLTVSKTLYEMSHDDWKEFNHNAHKDYFNGVLKYEKLDPKWLKRLDLQSDMFVELLNFRVLKYDCATMDYGAGDGELANKTNAKLNRIWMKKYDEYMESLDANYLMQINEGEFDFIVSSSVFEHLLGNRGEVEKIMEFLKPDGIMALHTLVCEEVPQDQDPDWYYISPVPVHCTLWTNKAMSIVFKKNGFIGCAYNV